MVKRYTAMDIEEGIYIGLDTETEFVLASAYAALESELARVKAESLRVVDRCEPVRADSLFPDALFTYCNNVYVITQLHDGSDYIWPMALNGEGVQQLLCQSPVQPVRLERWEDEG